MVDLVWETDFKLGLLKDFIVGGRTTGCSRAPNEMSLGQEVESYVKGLSLRLALLKLTFLVTCSFAFCYSISIYSA